MQHAPRVGCGQVDDEHAELSPSYVPFAFVHRALVNTSHAPDAKQHAPRAGCGQVDFEHVVLSPWYVPDALVQSVVVATRHWPEARQHAPCAGGVGHPPVELQALLGPKNRPCACSHASPLSTVHVDPVELVTQHAPVGGGGGVHAPVPHVVLSPR